MAKSKVIQILSLYETPWHLNGGLEQKISNDISNHFAADVVKMDSILKNLV